MNDDFYNEAFTADEQKQIMTTTIEEEGTADKLFLLREREAKHYVLTKSKRCCQTTAYAVAQSVKHGEVYYGSLVDSDSRECLWWLRTLTPLSEHNDVAGTSVLQNGRIEKLTEPVESAVCVRPVMWISLAD